MTDTVEEIERQLLIAMRRGRKLYQEAAESVHPGLEPAAYAFLIRLDTVGPSRPSDLAAYFGIGKATIGRQLSALEDLGLVGRKPDPDDRRAHFLALTDEGKQRLDAARSMRRRTLLDRLSSWSESDLATLRELLLRLNTDSGE